MKPRPFDYVRPDTVDEAVAILAEHGDEARVLAGGQTLLAMLNLRVVEPAVLVDITRIPELDVIREVDTHEGGGKIEVGAAVTQNRLMAWPSLAQKLAVAGGGIALRRPLPDPQQGNGLRLGGACRSHLGNSVVAGAARRRGRAALAPRDARSRRRRVPAGHAHDRARRR